MLRSPVLMIAFVVAIVPLASAQERITGANYPLAQKFNKDFVAQHVQEASVTPQWIGKTDLFWYAARGATGTKYWKVDPNTKQKNPLFDHIVLAAALSELSKKPLDGDTLKLERTTVDAEGKKMKFVFGPDQYEYDLTDAKLKLLGKAPPVDPTEAFRRFRDGEKQEEKKDDMMNEGEAAKTPAAPGASYKNYSPDKKKYAYLYKYNLYLAEEGQEEKAVPLSTDGMEDYTFATGFGGAGGFGKGGNFGGGAMGADTTKKEDRKTRPNLTWSADSKSFHITRSDSRNVKELFLVDSLGAPRPTLEKYKYPMPAEEVIRKTELLYGDAENKALKRVSPKWRDERYSDVRWDKATGELRFIRRDRLQRNLEVCSYDVHTGSCKCLFGESFEAANLEMQQPRYLEKTDDMIWWSERSGWGHFYRYGRDGKFKNAITSGAWRASRIVEVDAENGFVYFIGNAREKGENPYYTHLYRVKLDGSGLTCLDPADGLQGTTTAGAKVYSGVSPVSGYNQSSTLSPSKKFVVTNSTAVDHAPFATLRDDAGNVLMVLEQTNLTSLMKTGWQMPETFTVKAADGVTDLYGNMWKPFDFDPKKKYPIIANVYPGPQTEGVTYRFAAYSSTMQLAQLGFIVIQVGHRGGSPERSKAYHSYGYFNLRDYGLADKKAAIEALAARHGYIDIDRVGIFGHSGGGFMSAAAVLQKPYNEFFKAAVASAGNHDNNIYNDNWSEKYHGLKELSAEEAAKESKTGTGMGKGGTGFGNRRKGPTEAEIISEINDLIESFDPHGEVTIQEVEARIVDLTAQLDALRQVAVQDAKTAAIAPPPRPKGEAAKADAKLPDTKFEIKVPTNAELAANLKGHLLLVHGEIDNNVHPANTMRLADALIKANKRFDMLMIPGARHGFGVAQPYFTQRMWDFFAEHLLEDRQTGADINTKDVKRR